MHQQPLTYTQVGIIGAGELGSAIGGALTNHTQVLYYDKDPSRTTTASIEDLVNTCRLLLLCVPSWAVHDVSKKISKAASPNESRLVITLSKGVSQGFVTMDQVLTKELPRNYHIGVMYGPMLAEEISQHRSANGVLALSDNSQLEPLRQLFSQGNIFIEASGDMHGVSLAAVFKNVYAIALGMCDGLRLGLNAKGRIAVIALAEMKRLLAELGGNPQTAEGTAGLGDLLSTGFSGDSFNYRVGKSLAEGIVDSHVKSEGLVALDELERKVKLAHYPLAHFISQAAFHYAKPDGLIEILK